MENATYIGLSRQDALKRQLSVIANNIANMDTAGFKGQQVMFEEFMVTPEGAATPQAAEPVSMVNDLGSYRDLKQGAMTRTGNTLDLALMGEGYFALEGPAGPRYTRAGNFHLNNDREIVHNTGLPVLDDGGQRIVIPQDARDIQIDRNGVVVAGGLEVGQIQVATFADQQALTQVAGGLYITDQNPEAAPDTEIRQGFIEGSNVNPITEMTRMMDVASSYASTRDMLDTEHDRMRSAIQTLGSLNA